MKTAWLRVVAWAVAGASVVVPGESWSQAYPVKPLRLIVPGPAAGGVDVIARPIAHKLSESLGQQVIVDNRAGASGMIAGQAVAGSPPDGYAILLGTTGTHSIMPFLVKKRSYDPVRDFAPVTLIATTPLVVAAHPLLPVRSIKDLIALAKSHPGQLLYASNGTGTIHHLTAEMFNQAAGIVITHVPYKGGTPAVVDAMSGHVQLVVTALPTAMAQIKAARLRALAVTGARRSSALANVATMAEAGLAGFESNQWFSLFLPRNSPNFIIERLHGEVRKATDSPSVKAILMGDGSELAVDGPKALAEFHLADIARWEKVIRRAAISIE